MAESEYCTYWLLPVCKKDRIPTLSCSFNHYCYQQTSIRSVSLVFPILQDLISSHTLLKTNASIQMSSAAVSFVCSSMMAFMIKSSERSLSTPYRRIIFGVSISDMVQSLAFLLGPILIPSATPVSWGVGNETSCQVQGFFATLGTYIIPMYMCFLCFYYLCKLKYRMADDVFAHKYEKKLHFLVIMISVSISLGALVANVIHPTFGRTTCAIAATPIGCKVNPEVFGECDPIIEARATILAVLAQSLTVLSVGGIIVMMVMLHHHVITLDRRWSTTYAPPESEDISDGDLSCAADEDQRQSRHRSTYLSRLYRNEVVLEATFYAGAFGFTYVPLGILYIVVAAGAPSPYFLTLLVTSLLPIMGLFNILVYTRQQVSSLGRHNPELTWLTRFWIVLKSGGENSLLIFVLVLEESMHHRHLFVNEWAIAIVYLTSHQISNHN